MRRVMQLVPALFGFGVLIVMNGDVARAAKDRDVCMVAPTGGGSFNEFILKDVDLLGAGGVISVRGLYTSTGSQRISPFTGSATMGSDGQIRLGFFVFSTAQGGQNDFTAAGLLDGAYNGTMTYDNDGDFMPNGTLVMQRADCSTITLP